MQTGTINVQTENIFPIIKKFLYSDHEIFLRELVANAVDATQKLKTLAGKGEATGEIGDTTIEISLDADKGTLTILDRGIGMTKDEVKKYINQIAFSSAQEFLDKYKDESAIIGHFGLGFYSAFMVADKVEIRTKSFRDRTKAAFWSCDGSPEYQLDDSDKEERGTEITLFISEDSKEFLEKSRIETLLKKYCKFLPVSIKFGENERVEKDDDGNETTLIEDNIINNTEPAWTKKPSELTDEDYKSFYRELYPYSHDEPLFWIHLNVDYPFNLTGILYFPKLKSNIEVKKDKIGLYCNQVFVTDQVEEIVPEFLMLLHGVIDSPDIPLNVSRSYLQSDSNVKKINAYITKKVAAKLEEMFKKDREAFEAKWPDIGIFIKYGMLSEDKFFDKAKNFALVQNMEEKYATIDEHKEQIKDQQTNKDDKVVVLYTTHTEEQDSYIKTAQAKGYQVVQLNTIIDAHFVGFMEQKFEGIELKRVDADVVDKLIDKDEKLDSVLSEDEQTKLKDLFTDKDTQTMVQVDMQPMSPEEMPVLITKPEFMRRMREMSAYNGMDYMKDMPESYNLVVNTNHPLMQKVLKLKKEKKQRAMTKQLHDLALLSQNMLKGNDLTNFIKRSVDLID